MIRFDCACGKRLMVDDSLAGQPVQCPQCRAVTPAPAAPLAAPDALAAALRDVKPAAGRKTGPSSAMPVAREVAPPPAAAPTADPLGALAQAAARSPKPRPAALKPANGRKPAKKAEPGRPGAPPPRRKGNTTVIVSVIAAVGVLIVIVALFAILGRDDDGPTREKLAPPPLSPENQAELNRPRRRTGPQPGELFKNVPTEKAREEEAGGK
jgi:hypothetical protein